MTASANIHFLENNMMTCNSICGVSNKSNHFGVTVWFDILTYDQAQLIIARAENLYEVMGGMKEKIIELYGEEPTKKLVENFSEIIHYSEKIMVYGEGDAFEEYFRKLENFCGQIENIIKMIRYYYCMVKK